ncbi:MAG: hypothetical protein LBF12_04720 [Christensenellaceae bacterium]|jgi:hypothetical protein|nr:hypothetical protein [Christensenellaceae bacterium]
MEFILFHQTEGIGTIVYNGQKLEFYIGFIFDIQFHLVLKPDKYSPLAGKLLNYDDVVGSMEFNKKEKKLILEFRSSDVFGDAFSTITLTSVEFDPLEINPKERYNVSWISDVPDIRFYIRKGETKGGRGLVEIEDISQKIFFEWNDDQKFSVYLLDINEEKQFPSVLEGNYSGGATSFEIVLVKDELFNGIYQTITFLLEKEDKIWYNYAFD